MLSRHFVCRGTASVCFSNARNNSATPLVARATAASGSPAWSSFRTVSTALQSSSLQDRHRPFGQLIALRCFTSKSKTKLRSKKSKRRDEAPAPALQRIPAYLDTLIQLRNALTDGDTKAVTDAYLDIRGTLQLGGEDVAAIAQTLHTALRRRRPDPKEKQPNADLLYLADLLVKDIQSTRLPPNHAAHLHLLGFYREAKHLDKGIQLWEWLERQDDSYVSPSVYGVAIELLAIQGRPAEETESLYIQALKRFPGSFNEYHLSPDAVLPDLTRPFNIKGIPVTLLQGVLTARLLRGDSKSAYLAFDTALRLFPTQLPSRFYTLFVVERPVTEAYKVFMMATRSGTAIGADCLKALLSKLRAVAVVEPLHNASVLRSILTACYAFAASGSPLTSNHLTEVVIAITSILQHPTISALPKEEVSQLADHLLLAVNRLFDIWSNQGARPGIAAFNSIITNVAGKAQRSDVIDTCLADMHSLDLEPNAVTRRSLLKAAGDIGDTELLKATWVDLFASRHATGASVELADWQTLAKAARQSGQEQFARQELQQASSTMSSFLVDRILGLLEERPAKAKADINPTLAGPIRHLIGTILQDILYMENQLESSRFRDFCLEPLPTSFSGSEYLQNMPEEQLRAVYNEMSIDTSFTQSEPEQSEERVLAAAQAESMPDGGLTALSLEAETSSAETHTNSPPAVSSTGFGYAELRYENWKTINELLAESNERDSEYITAIDAAIREVKQPPKRGSGWKTPGSPGPSVGLSNIPVTRTSPSESTTPVDRDDNIRKTIFQLRGRSG